MKEYYYLVHIQYLGFRFHGWQKQPDQKTVHYMIDKTLEYALGHTRFKTLGCSRTDAKVSANHYVLELFMKEPLDLSTFLDVFNDNLPNDIRGLKVEETDKTFNIINTPRIKEYHYMFTFGEKPHPFAASIMIYFKGDLDIEKMQAGARLFEGEHDFVRYCTRPSENTKLVRTIERCELVENELYKANFFPEQTYILKIEASGFLRYQVRLIMGQLVRLGRGEIDLNEIEESLKGENRKPLDQIAPASGLILNEIRFD